MALKNYILQADLSGYYPELDVYLWAGQTTYSNQKLQAESEVRADFVDRGFQVRNLRPPLVLDTVDENENADIGNRNRCVIVVSTVTATAVVTITGANDPDDTFVTCGTSASLTATGTSTFLLTDEYQYYKYSNTGSMTSTVSLVESDNYDQLYKLKWLSLIMLNARVTENDAYDMAYKELTLKYKDRWQGFQPFYDEDGDGEITQSEKQDLKFIPVVH
jgi:hypothetical protein